MKITKLIVAAFVLAMALSVPGQLLAQKMKVGYWTSGFSLGFGAVMEQMKFAEAQGLNVEWVKFAEVNGPTRAIVSNAIDIAFAAPSTNSIGIAADGVPVKIVLATQIAEAQIVVLDGSPIKAVGEPSSTTICASAIWVASTIFTGTPSAAIPIELVEGAANAMSMA